jgi:ABC-type Na+ transport system ATPase subunit NatA
MTAPAIELLGFEKRLGNFRLGPLDLAVPSGTILALIGPNGAGKTTTRDLLMGMGRPDAGRIRMLGMDLARDEVAIKRRTACVNPDLDYRAWGTVGAAIDFVRGFYPDWDDGRCERLLGELRLSRDEKVATLSFGVRIKLALVLALARDAELLLLVAVSRRLLFAELLSFMQRPDRTIVISSHQLADLERFARQSESGAPADVIRISDLHFGNACRDARCAEGSPALNRAGPGRRLFLDASRASRGAACLSPPRDRSVLHRGRRCGELTEMPAMWDASEFAISGPISSAIVILNTHP